MLIKIKQLLIIFFWLLVTFIATTLLAILICEPVVAQDWVENNGKREWAHAKRTMVKVSHELETISWPGLPDSTYFKVDVGSITDSIWYIGDTTYIGIEEFYHARFYNIGDNNIEWDAILYQKPGNQYSWTFPIERNNLTFFYQGELAQWQIDEGWERPDSVVGSYAVYHSYKGGNLIPVADTAYKVGKAFHVFRPKAWDSADSTVWLDMEIDTIANTMTISGTRQWFRDAVYPVVIDPKFGYETEGGTGGILASNNKMRFISKATTGADAAGAALDSINYMIHTLTSGPYNIIFGLYDDNAGAPRDSITSQTSGESINSTGWILTTTAFESHSLSASTVYYFVNLNTASNTTRLKIWYDDTPGVNWTWSNSCCKYTDYPTLPASLTGSVAAEYRGSMYGIYSGGAAPAEPTGGRRNKILKGE